MNQLTLFPANEYVDLSIGMTERSTKRKKRSPSLDKIKAIALKPTNQTNHGPN